MGGDPEHPLGAEQLAIFVIGALGEDDQVVLALVHPLEQFLGGLTAYIDDDLGMGALEAGEDHRQQPHGIVVGETEADGALEIAVGEQVHDLGIDPEHAPGPGVDGLAMAGQRHRARVARQKRVAKPFLEALDLHRHRRLRLVHPPRGFGEAAAIGNGAEALQLIEIERNGHAELHHGF